MCSYKKSEKLNEMTKHCQTANLVVCWLQILAALYIDINEKQEQK